MIVLVLASLTASCGYHLRGNVKLPKELNSVFVEGASQPLYSQFKNSLEASSGKILSSPEKAGVVVKVRDEEFRRRILSLSSRGRSNEVELDYRIEYELYKSGKVLLPLQTVQLRREYFNDQDDIIARENEEKVIRDEMYQQIVQGIISLASAELKSTRR